MAVFPPDIQELMPWDNLQSFIDDWTKGVQEIADLLDPDIDNSGLPIVLGTDFSVPIFWRVTVSNLTDAYNDWLHSFGGQPYLLSGQLNVSGSTASVSHLTVLGKLKDGAWLNFNDADKEYVDGLINSYPFGSKFSIININNAPIVANVSPSADPTYLSVPLLPYGYAADTLYYHNLDYADTALNSNLGILVHNLSTYVETEEATQIGYIGITGGNSNTIPNIALNPLTPHQLPFIGTTEDQNFIDKYVTGNGAEHNYHVTTSDGYDVYYGDNYYIIKTNNQPVTYNKIYNTITTTLPDIDPEIHVPTYDENKYGPEPPEPSELVSDNQEDGGNYNHAEFTKVYACTSAELENLYQWMGGGAAGSSGTSPVTVPDNFDPMNRIVGLIGYPMIIDAGVGDETTFTFRNAVNQTINTGWSTYKYANFDRAFDFGTVDIPNWEEVNNGAPFLDYSATVEIYIPFCGIVGLDPQAVMGCTLSCKMWIDFLTGDCSAVVYTNYGAEDAQHPVAFVSGNCGSAEVVSANAFGAYQGAKAQASHKMSQAIIGGFKDLATSVIGGATTGFTRGAANPSGAGGSAGMRAGAIGSVIGGAMNLGVNLTLQNMDNRYAVQVAKNALGTTISGSFGQQTSWYYMDTPYIKVTWPTPISKDVELYGKTFGVPVHRSGVLSEFTGYTVCNNVDVSGIADATASELAIIKQFLETGVFIKEGGGE